MTVYFGESLIHYRYRTWAPVNDGFFSSMKYQGYCTKVSIYKYSI